MITNNDRNYDQNESNITDQNQSYVDQYQQEHDSDENNFEQELPLNEDQNLNNEFSDALERDDEENDIDEDDLDEDDLDEDDLDENDLDDDLIENYDENDREPETFSDDGYKID
jgi:hypothetical protein